MANEPSRQRKWQLRQKEKGLCCKCNSKVHLGGIFCLRHMTSTQKGVKLGRREAWKKVDWSLPIADIALQMGVGRNSVYHMKKKLKL